MDKAFSYFPESLDVTSAGLLNIDEDYFTEYFTVDYMRKPILVTGTSTLSPIADTVIVPVDKQLRYSRFSGGNAQGFADTFFRGVKVLIKERSESDVKINFNLQQVKYKKDNRFNDYKFSVVLLPHSGEYPKGTTRKKIEMEFVENRKFKHLTFIIYAQLDDLINQIEVEVAPGISVPEAPAFIDRTILYALNSKFKTIDPTEAPTSGIIEYDDVPLNGAIDMRLTSDTRDRKSVV